MLSTQAFNALLKTLEEPPKHVYFVFATTAPHKIPETIKSRCQRHHFKRLEIKEIAGRLETISSAEKFRFEEEGLRLLARKADGSMRDGTSLLDQCVTSSNGNVTTEAVREILGLIDQERVLAFMESIAGGDPTTALKLLDACIDEGLDIQELCSALLEGYRDLMLLAVPGDLSDLLYWSQDEVELFRKLLPRYELPDLVTIVERLCDAVPRLKSAADPRISLETLLVDLSLLDRQVDIRRLISDLEASEGGDGNGGSGTRGRGAGGSPRTSSAAEGAETNGPGASASVLPGGPDGVLPARPRAVARRETKTGTGSPAGSTDEAGPQKGALYEPVSGEGELDFDTLCELWDGFVTFVRQKKVSLGVCLISARLHAFDGKTLSLRFMKNCSLQKDQVSSPANVGFLKKTLKKYFQQDIEIECFSEGEERPGKPQRAGAGQIRGISKEKKPIVEKIMKDFDGEIIRYHR
jgi:DNA polymerase-3 subunit gamma/tau